jgi:hypothetical protein
MWMLMHGGPFSIKDATSAARTHPKRHDQKL